MCLISGKSISQEDTVAKKNLIFAAIVGLGLLLGGFAYGQMGAPAENVSGKRHPHLAQAQRLANQAFEQVSAAQSANEFDMAGHAAHAKELLDQASKELKEAAEAANKH
jgi:F0F1-type ATP synthase membrane subunit b/b'